MTRGRNLECPSQKQNEITKILDPICRRLSRAFNMSRERPRFEEYGASVEKAPNGLEIGALVNLEREGTGEAQGTALGGSGHSRVRDPAMPQQDPFDDSHAIRLSPQLNMTLFRGREHVLQ